MKTRNMSNLVLALIFAAATSTLARVSEASLILTNVSLSSTQVSLRVIGTVESADLNDTDLDSLFFGFDNGGDASWISSVSGYSVNHNAGTYIVRTDSGNEPGGGSEYGGRLFTNGDPDDGNITAGTTVDYNLTWDGSFNFSGYSASDLVVQVGYTSLSPVIGGTNTLAGGTVPEPSSILTLAGLALCFGLAGWRRKRRQAR